MTNMTAIKSKIDPKLVSYKIVMPTTGKIWLGFFGIFILVVIAYGSYLVQPIDNQKEALQQIALYTKEVTDMPPSNARDEYLVLTKNKLLETGELRLVDVQDIKANYEKALESTYSNRQTKNEIINQIETVAIDTNLKPSHPTT